jgi:hypothetical protein
VPRFVSTVAKKLLPDEVIDRYRRRRALRRYLRSLSYEIYDRQKLLRVEQLEGAVLARRPDLTERLMKDLLERMDLVLQELHREVEGVRARHGTELRELREEMAGLRAAFQELQSRLGVHEPAAD